MGERKGSGYVLVYADDTVLSCPTWAALQQLLDVFFHHICRTDMVCNIQKTVCMVFSDFFDQHVKLKLLPQPFLSLD